VWAISLGKSKRWVSSGGGCFDDTNLRQGFGALPLRVFVRRVLTPNCQRRTKKIPRNRERESNWHVADSTTSEPTFVEQLTFRDLITLDFRTLFDVVRSSVTTPQPSTIADTPVTLTPSPPPHHPLLLHRNRKLHAPQPKGRRPVLGRVAVVEEPPVFQPPQIYPLRFHRHNLNRRYQQRLY